MADTFDLSKYFTSKFQNVSKDPAAIRSAAEAILASEGKVGVGNNSYLGWARSALQQLDRYDSIKRGEGNAYDNHGRDQAAYALDKAYSWITGAAQPTHASRVLEQYDRTKVDLSKKIQDEQSNIANILDFSSGNVPAEEQAKLSARAKIMQDELNPLIESAKFFGIDTTPKLTRLGSGFVPTADLATQAPGAAPGGSPATTPVSQSFQPTEYSTTNGLTNLQKTVYDTSGTLKANDAFINAVFKAFHGRDATAAELTSYRDKNVADVRNEVIGGAQAAGLPTVAPGTVALQTGILTPQQAQQQGLQKVLRPDQLSAFREDQIVRDNMGGIYLRTDNTTAEQRDAVASGKSGSQMVNTTPTVGPNVSATDLNKGSTTPTASDFMNLFLGGNGSSSDITTAITTTASDYIKSLVGDYDKQIADLRTKLAAGNSDMADLTKRVTDLSTGTPNQDALEDAIKVYGLQEKRDKLSEIQIEIANLQAQLQLGKVKESNKLAPLSIIGQRQATLEAQTTAKIGALAAIAQVYQGDIDFAKGMIDATVTAMNADRTQQLNALDTLITLKEKDIANITDEESALIKARQDALHDAMDSAQKNADKVFDLIKDNPDAALKGGVLVSDSPAVALSKMAPYMTSTEKANTQVIDLGGRKVLIDMNTGKEIQSFADVGGRSGGGSSSGSESDRQLIANDMAAIRGSDGFYDTEKYQQIRQSIAVNSPGLLTWFNSTYPEAGSLNPNDPTALRYLRTNEQTVEAAKNTLSDDILRNTAQQFLEDNRGFFRSREREKELAVQEAMDTKSVTGITLTAQDRQRLIDFINNS